MRQRKTHRTRGTLAQLPIRPWAVQLVLLWQGSLDGRHVLRLRSRWGLAEVLRHAAAQAAAAAGRRRL